jgi:hypothetical protein
MLHFVGPSAGNDAQPHIAITAANGKVQNHIFIWSSQSNGPIESIE